MSNYYEHFKYENIIVVLQLSSHQNGFSLTLNG